jgi:hypothetical protein
VGGNTYAIGIWLANSVGSTTITLAPTTAGGPAAAVSNTGTVMWARAEGFASGPPNGSGGLWGVGDRLWNVAPASGQPMGWICVAGSTNGGTWLAMPNL